MKRISALLLTSLMALPAFGDEGMWTYNNFPSAAVKAKYGFEPTKEWLDHARLASVRIAGGCSASVVSPNGLVMTNHHCARGCIEDLSNLKKKDFNRDGFFAKTENDEVKCPGFELNQLAEITDVTKRVQDATKGNTDAKFIELQRAAIAAIEKECATSDDVRCEVISLYRGGRYDLYKYRRLSDIRLVMAPEDRIAFFGGDPENFTFPRFNLDVSFLRIYGSDGKPAKMEHFKWAAENVKDGELTFVSGNPAVTSRTLTVAQLEDDRDFRLPFSIARAAEQRGLFAGYQERGAEQRRHSNDVLFSVENRLKAAKGRHAALADPDFYAKLVSAEADFRKKIAASPALKGQFANVWDDMAKLVKKNREIRREYDAVEFINGGDLLRIARTLVRYADETVKPNAERLKEYTDSRLPQVKSRLLSNAPIINEFETTRLAFTLSKLREDLGVDHPVVRKVLGNKSPNDVAAALVKGTAVGDLKLDSKGKVSGVRNELFMGGKVKLDASKDPMIELARAIDPDARAIRARYETEIEGPLKKQQELLAKARFEAYGTSTYPDATFTLRLSYGSVKGYHSVLGKDVTPFTTIGGAFEHATGADPFALPKSWLDAKSKLSAGTPFNFVTTNDIIGGNSGSPVFNKNAEIIGLVFDGNIESLGGEYGFDEPVNRAIAVHSGALTEALEKIYGARRLVDEIKGTTGGVKAGQK